MKIARITGLLLCLLLAACGVEIPLEKSDYVGRWQGNGMDLQITGDGRVQYQRQQGTTSTSVSGPIKAFDGNDFEVGIGFLSTRFKVDEAPHKVDGQWRMRVDGVPLRRLD